MARHAYELLGISPHASADEIRAAFLTRASLLHPDRNPLPQAAREFRAVRWAYEQVGEPARRRVYDRLPDAYDDPTRRPFRRDVVTTPSPSPQPTPHRPARSTASRDAGSSSSSRPTHGAASRASATRAPVPSGRGLVGLAACLVLVLVAHGAVAVFVLQELDHTTAQPRVSLTQQYEDARPERYRPPEAEALRQAREQPRPQRPPLAPAEPSASGASPVADNELQDPRPRMPDRDARYRGVAAHKNGMSDPASLPIASAASTEGDASFVIPATHVLSRTGVNAEVMTAAASLLSPLPPSSSTTLPPTVQPDLQLQLRPELPQLAEPPSPWAWDTVVSVGDATPGSADGPLAPRNWVTPGSHPNEINPPWWLAPVGPRPAAGAQGWSPPEYHETSHPADLSSHARATPPNRLPPFVPGNASAVMSQPDSSVIPASFATPIQSPSIPLSQGIEPTHSSGMPTFGNLGPAPLKMAGEVPNSSSSPLGRPSASKYRPSAGPRLSASGGLPEVPIRKSSLSTYGAPATLPGAPANLPRAPANLPRASRSSVGPTTLPSAHAPSGLPPMATPGWRP